VAEDVPEGEENGLVYTFRIRPGIYFQDDPAFGGKQRELTAEDAAYSLKRLMDPKNRAPYAWLVEGKIVGLDDVRTKAIQTGSFDYDAPIEGLQILDRYTLRVRLTLPDFNFLYIFTMPQTAPVAREVMERYAADTMAHPVGTGPYRLVEWVRRSKIVLERNPRHRGYELETKYADPGSEDDRRVIEEIGGKRLPLLDRVEIYPIEAEQPRFLAFMNGEHDILQETPFAFINQVVPNGELAPVLKAQGVSRHNELSPDLTYYLFNLEHPVLGGYTAEKVALRRAIVMGHDRPAEINIIRRGQVMAAQSPIPPGMIGYDPTFRAREQEYDPVRAKALLDTYHYVDANGDGWRDLPDGSPLVIDYMYSTGGLDNRQLAELLQKSMQRIGVRLVPRGVQFSDQLRDRKAGKFMMSSAAWIADWPDAQNFLQLLYGPNSAQSNDARFRNEQFDRAYEQALQMPDSPQRDELYRQMSRIVAAYAPWRLGVHRGYVHLTRPWVLGYKKHPMYHINIKYLDLDLEAQRAASR
jgi:ABC-type transport system substrate-binding protein